MLAISSTKLRDDISQRSGGCCALGLFGFSEILEILIVFESSCHGAELLNRKDYILFQALLTYELRMEIHRSPLGVNVPSMHYAVYDDCAFFDFEENPIVANAKPIFRREIRETFYVSGQSLLQLPYLCRNPRGFFLREAAQILNRSGL